MNLLNKINTTKYLNLIITFFKTYNKETFSYSKNFNLTIIFSKTYNKESLNCSKIFHNNLNKLINLTNIKDLRKKIFKKISAITKKVYKIKFKICQI